MKIFNIALAVGAAFGSRVKRETNIISLSGNENQDVLMQYLTDLTKGTNDELDQLIQQFMGVDRNVFT